MKKIILTFIFSIIGYYLFAQNTNIIVNNGQNQSTYQRGELLINGISSKEDIGGVTAYMEEVGINVDGTKERIVSGKLYKDSYVNCVFRNDNPFPVTVVFQGRWNDRISFSGSITLQANETRKYRTDALADQVITITRRLGHTKDPVNELKRYKELLDAGIITQTEFNAKKKEILGM